jgi:hypothetical protein
MSNAPVGNIAFGPSTDSHNLCYEPANVSRRMVRQQTFLLANGSEFAAVVGQLSILLRQLHDSKFTGKIEIDFNQGSMLSVNSVDSKKL